jgi:hypothetical protein
MVGAVLLSCSNDEIGKPFISYIRVTNPTASDSLIATAGQGQVLAIMGSNLQAVRQVWFNDQPALIYPTFITSTTVITQVPSVLPTVISNKLKMIFANGDSLLYDFSVDISKPRIDYAKSEYANEGDSLFIYGGYFYKPFTVTFTGGQQAELISVDDDATAVVVKVPTGAQPGPITITTNFGEATSNFWFEDNRNIIANFEGPFVNGWWRGGDFVVASDPDIANINGKFMRVNKGPLSAWPYLELYGGPADGDVATLTKVIPEAAFVNPSGYSLKLEINTLASITGAYVRLYLGSAGGGTFGDARNNIYYIWQPNISTHGTWQTVTIPWSDVYTGNQLFPYNSSGYGMYIYCHGPNAANYNFALDNIRVVPNTSTN